MTKKGVSVIKKCIFFDIMGMQGQVVNLSVLSVSSHCCFSSRWSRLRWQSLCWPCSKGTAQVSSLSISPISGPHLATNVPEDVGWGEGSESRRISWGTPGVSNLSISPSFGPSPCCPFYRGCRLVWGSPSLPCRCEGRQGSLVYLSHLSLALTLFSFFQRM
jgi:hypothetical protein